MKKNLRMLCLFSLTVGLLSACEAPDNYTSFAVNDVPDAYRFQVNIPVDEFMTRHLNGYTDPDLRRILSEATAENQAPAQIFNALAELATASGYELAEYLPDANPELFAGLNSNQEICDKLAEIYTTEMRVNLEKLHNHMDTEDIKHNILINKDLNLIIELTTSAQSGGVQEVISGDRNKFLYFSGVCMLHECIENLIFINEISNRGDSLTGVNQSLFSHLLLPSDVYGDGISSYEVFSGQSHVKDTAYVSSLLRAYRDSMPDPMDFGWQKSNELFPEQADMLSLCFLKPFDENRCVTSQDVEDAFAAESSYNPEQWEIQVIMTESGAEKWFNQTKESLGDPIAIILNGEIVATPIVQEAIADGISTINGNYTREEAESLADRIRSQSLPYAMQIVQKGPVH